MSLNSLRRLERGGVTAVLVTTVAFASPSDARAQCPVPANHFRGGLWKEWVVQILPGPRALAAVERVVAEMNETRAQVDPPIPPLVFVREIPLLFSVFEESDPRGPDGLPLSDRTPNREVLLTTFALVEGGGEVAVLLADPLRSNQALTAKGVPGAAASIERTMLSVGSGPASRTSTHWTATNGLDLVHFDLTYASAAISSRSRFPAGPQYLNCDYGHFLDLVFRSSPQQTYGVYDRSHTSFLFDLTRKDVKLRLKVRHHDPEVQAIFNDPENVAWSLSDAERVIWWQRQ